MNVASRPTAIERLTIGAENFGLKMMPETTKPWNYKIFSVSHIISGYLGSYKGLQLRETFEDGAR